MERIKYFISGLLVALLLGFVVSCSGSECYTPGEKTAENSPSVYFSSDNDCNLFVRSNDDKIDIPITLKRKNTKGELTVPIVVSSMSGSFNIPESATFEDGSEETSITVTYDQFESGMAFTLSIPERYTNHYISDGISTHTVSLLMPVKICDITYDTKTVFGQVTSELYNYSGNNLFLWKNFLGSNIDVKFKVKPSSTSMFDANDLTKLNGTIELLDHTYDYYNNGSLYLLDDDGNYATWTPAGQTSAITYLYMYLGSYSQIDFAVKNRSGYLYVGYISSYLSFYLNYNE